MTCQTPEDDFTRISELPIPEVQNVGDFLGARTFIMLTVKMFTSPCIISPMLPIINNTTCIMREISVKCGSGTIKRKCGRFGMCEIWDAEGMMYN